MHRYVEYFEAVVESGSIPAEPELRLQAVTVSGLSRQQLAGAVVVISERCKDTGHMIRVSLIRATPGIMYLC